MNRQRFLMLTSGLAIGLAMASVAAAQDCPGLTSDIDPDNFVRRVKNPFFPLTPGTRFIYKGVKADVQTSDVVYVTDDTKTILGVKCIVVHHQSYEGKDRVLV